MTTVFLSILNLSINASWLILAVMTARLLLKRAPKWIACLLWGLVALRLLCPLSPESALSLVPNKEVIPGNIETVENPHIDSGVGIIDNAINPVMEGSLSPDDGASANPIQIVVFAACVIWFIGMAVSLFYALISYILLKRRVRASVTIRGRIKECDEVASPFILGVLHPIIYVPSGLNEKTLGMVTAHEEAHLKRLDHLWKPLGFILLSVYWFNPLCIAAYILLCRDIEAACDERVISDKDREYTAAYAQALLDCSIQKRSILAACPLAFGETNVKERVRGVLNYKKPAFWVIVVAVIACIAVAVCFMTSPKKNNADTSSPIEKNVTGPIMLMSPAYAPYLQSAENETESSENVMDWMDITLPQGYSIGDFRDNIGWMGGFLILPESYNTYNAEASGSAPIEWRYSGLISRIPASSTGIEFINGFPQNYGVPLSNHTEANYIGTVGLERSTYQWPAIMLNVSHDLYTVSELSDLEKAGIHIEESETVSDYWEFWFVKEKEETYYILTLSAKEFSEKEATKIAYSVAIK